MKSLIQGFLTGTRGQARALAPRKVLSPRFSRHLNTLREISPLWEESPAWGFKSPLGHFFDLSLLAWIFTFREYLTSRAGDATRARAAAGGHRR